MKSKKEYSKFSDLLESVEQAIIDLSVHPAGCEDWYFYEQLCLEVADRLEAAIKSSKTTSNKKG